MCIKVANRRESADFATFPTGADGEEEDDAATRMTAPATTATTTMPEVMIPGYSRTREMSTMVRALTHVVSGERGSTMTAGGEWVSRMGGSAATGVGSASSPPSSSFSSSSSWGGGGGGGGGSSSSSGQKRGREEEASQVPHESLLRYYRGGFGDVQMHQGGTLAEAGMSSIPKIRMYVYLYIS